MRRGQLTLLALGTVGLGLPRSRFALWPQGAVVPGSGGERGFAVAACKAQSDSQTRLSMRIAQIAPLTEAIPPKLYGGTERVISWLADELVALGHDVVLFASGDSQTSANLEACWPKALRLDGSVRDPNALHMAVLERVLAA